MTNQSANQNSVAGTSKDQTARKIALNSVLNFLGAVLPMLVGLATIPSLLHSLGNERFAILSLMWSIIIYFSVFDFGIGRAVTKFVAEYAARNRTPSLRRLVPSAILLQLVIGVVLACVVAAIVPFIVGSLKDLPSNMVRETTVSLYLLVVSLPLMFGANAARGALEGQHRFGLVNSIRVPSTVSVFLFPWIAVQFSPILEISVTSLVFSRALVFVAYLVFAIRAFPPIGSVTARLVTLYIKKLASYGGWVALGVCLGSLMAMAYLDRFLIGSILSVGDLAYYSAPFEIIARLLVIPAAFVTVLFPLFSALTKEKTIALHDRSVRYVAIVFLPVVMFVFVMAHDFLSIWIDVEFAVTRCASNGAAI